MKSNIMNLTCVVLLILSGLTLSSFFSKGVSFSSFVQFWSVLASIGTIVAAVVAVSTMNTWKRQLRTTDEYKNDLIKINGIQKIQDLTMDYIDVHISYFTALWSDVKSLDVKELTVDDEHVINDLIGKMKEFRSDFINSEFHHLKLNSIINETLYRSEINPFGLNESEKEKFDNYSALVNLISRLVFRNTHMYAMRGQNYQDKEIIYNGIEYDIFDIEEKLREQLINEHRKIVDSYNKKWKLR